MLEPIVEIWQVIFFLPKPGELGPFFQKNDDLKKVKFK